MERSRKLEKYIEVALRLWNFRYNPFKTDRHGKVFTNLQKRIARVPDAKLARAVLRRSLVLLDERRLSEQNRKIQKDIITQLDLGFPDLSTELWEAFIEDLKENPYLGDRIDVLEQRHRIYMEQRTGLGSDQEEVNEAVELASNQPKSSAEASAIPLEKPPARYNNLAAALGAIGTLGGSITYAALLQLGVSCNDQTIRSLLGYASVLFFGSLFTSIPVILAVGDADENQDLPSRTVWFLWLQLFFAAIMDAVAYICLLLVVLQIALPGPYFVGFAISVAAVLWCMIALMWFIRLYAFIPQIVIFVILLIVTALVPADQIPLVNHLNRTHLNNPCSSPPPAVNCCW